MHFLILLLFGVLFSFHSFALEILHVEGTSTKVDLEGQYTPNFIAGMSGKSYCTDKTFTTLDTCSLKKNRAACNYNTVCPSTRLKLTFKAKTNGKISLRDISDRPVYQLGEYKAGTVQTVEIPWSEICLGLMSDRACSVPARGVLQIGIDSGGTDHSEESSNFIFQVSRLENNYLDMETKESLSLSKRDGIEDYSLIGGDQSIFVIQASVKNLFLESRITGFRAFYETANCHKVSKDPNTLNTSSPSVFIEFDQNQSEILNPKITGVQNGLKYAVMLGLQDDAGNIGYFKDLSGKQCVEGQHTAIPLAQ